MAGGFAEDLGSAWGSGQHRQTSEQGCWERVGLGTTWRSCLSWDPSPGNSLESHPAGKVISLAWKCPCFPTKASRGTSCQECWEHGEGQHWPFSTEVVPKMAFMQQKAAPPSQRSFTRSKSLGSSLNARAHLMPCAQQSQDCFAPCEGSTAACPDTTTEAICNPMPMGACFSRTPEHNTIAAGHICLSQVQAAWVMLTPPVIRLSFEFLPEEGDRGRRKQK